MLQHLTLRGSVPRRTRSALAIAVVSVLALPLLAAAQPVLEGTGSKASAQANVPPLANAGAAGVATDTVAIVALSGYQRVMDDIGYFGGLFGQPRQADQLEGMLSFFTGQRGLEGLDKERPVGVVVRPNGVGFSQVICLPVTDLTALLEIAQMFGVMADDAGGGVTELSVPQSPKPLFVKSEGEWAFISDAAETLDDTPADPTAVLTDLVADYDLGVRVFLKQLPVQELYAGFEDGMVQGPEETDEEFEERRRVAEAQLKTLATTLEDADEATIGVVINGDDSPGVSIDLAMTADAGTDVAAELARSAELTKTDFAAFIDESATMLMSLHAVTPPEKIAEQEDQVRTMMEVYRKQAAEAIDDESELDEETAAVFKDALDDILDAYEETVLSGVVDSVTSVNVSPDGFAVRFGAMVKSPEKVESALKKLADHSKGEPKAPKVEWNAETHAGIQFHRITFDVPKSGPGLTRVLGDTIDAVVGIGDEKVYFSAGEDAFAALTGAIDESAAMGETPVQPIVMSLSMTSIAETGAAMDDPNSATARIVAKMLEDSGGKDKLRMTIEPIDNGARFRIQAEEGVLRALGVIGAEAARQLGPGLQPGGGPPPF